MTDEMPRCSGSTHWRRWDAYIERLRAAL